MKVNYDENGFVPSPDDTMDSRMSGGFWEVVDRIWGPKGDHCRA